MASGYKKIEARWEVYHQTDFFGVDDICGDFEAAKAAALAYLRKYHPAITELVWLEGVPNKYGSVYYANHPLITMRISQ